MANPMAKKKLSRIEFVKLMLAESDREKCLFCKYNISNYYDINKDTKRQFFRKCIHCIYSGQWAYEGERPPWVYSCFKTLYFWEGANND